MIFLVCSSYKFLSQYQIVRLNSKERLHGLNCILFVNRLSCPQMSKQEKKTNKLEFFNVPVNFLKSIKKADVIL